MVNKDPKDQGRFWILYLLDPVDNSIVKGKVRSVPVHYIGTGYSICP